MAKAKTIVKRLGHEEKFDERKVYASCYSACLIAQIGHINAEKICAKVTDNVKKWLTKKKEVTSDDIFRQTIELLKKHSKPAAFMYETHRDIN